MADLRQKVESDRGLIKQIELIIPGFRGYRLREDLRIADSLLRTHLADRLVHVRGTAEECRSQITRKSELGLIEEMGEMVTTLETVENQVRHAEQGYTGISPDHRIEERELNRMYEWDLGLLQSIDHLDGAMTGLLDIIDGGDMKRAAATLKDTRRQVSQFKKLFSTRREAFAGLSVEG